MFWCQIGWHDYERKQRCNAYSHSFYDKCLRCGKVVFIASRHCGKACDIYQGRPMTQYEKTQIFLEEEVNIGLNHELY